MNKKLYSTIIIFLSVIAIAVLFHSCANIIPPTGGPRDSLPPVLLSAIPKDSSLNLISNKIILSFNEYIQLDNNLNDNLIISPNPLTTPIIEGKLKTVTIKLRDSLLPNTTYSINFGNALKDVNEGNSLKNFTYLFSTGSTIDDGQISGSVVLAQTGKIDSTLIAILHKNLNDTAVKKERPLYYAKLDGKGSFVFRNLPNGDFNLFVLPNDYSKKYDDSTKLFAFLNKPVTVSNSGQNIMLYAYAQVERTEIAVPGTEGNNNPRNVPKDKSLKLLNSLETGNQDLLQGLEFTVNRKFQKFDSSKIVLSDTNFKATSNYSFVVDTSLTKITLQHSWPENEPFKLVILKEAFSDTAGNTLSKNDTLSFTTKRESDYGSVRIHFNNIDLAKNPVLLLVQNDKIVQSVLLAKNEWYQKLFQPGEYELRILFDDNRNGVWDAGNFELKRQPEKVIQITRKLSTKSNWDNEVDINL